MQLCWASASETKPISVTLVTLEKQRYKLLNMLVAPVVLCRCTGRWPHEVFLTFWPGLFCYKIWSAGRQTVLCDSRPLYGFQCTINPLKPRRLPLCYTGALWWQTWSLKVNWSQNQFKVISSRRHHFCCFDRIQIRCPGEDYSDFRMA